MTNTIPSLNLHEKAKVIRRHIIDMIFEAGSGHPGGSLSAADILTVLYFSQLKHDPSNPSWTHRDRFILSKGHCAPVLYAVLAESGYFPKEQLKKLRKIGSSLQGHPDMRKTPGVEVSTGSLGQGLSIANGMALGCRMDNLESKIFVLLGDGEADEGQVWEAAMLAAHYRLDNIIVFLDHNRLQVDGPTSQVMNLEPLAEKWKAFGWQVMVIDGHNIDEILKSIETARSVKEKPTIIIANTIKGKGISFMENNAAWHGKAPNNDEYLLALKELATEEDHHDFNS